MDNHCSIKFGIPSNATQGTLTIRAQRKIGTGYGLWGSDMFGQLKEIGERIKVAIAIKLQ